MTVKQLKDIIAADARRLAERAERNRAAGGGIDDMYLMDRAWANKYESLHKKTGEIETREEAQRLILQEIGRDTQSLYALVYEPRTPYLDAHIRSTFGFLRVLTDLLGKLL